MPEKKYMKYKLHVKWLKNRKNRRKLLKNRKNRSMLRKIGKNRTLRPAIITAVKPFCWEDN